MAAPFDHITPSFDSLFTKSAIGQLQRKHVWRYIEKIVPELNGFEMLEINCGSGEDANLFSEAGFNLVATDIGQEMLKVTDKKVEQFSMQQNISSQYLDLDSLNQTLFNKKFDLIFSNFGGLNCVSPEAMKKLLKKLPSMLNPGGRFVGVIMPKFCAWETIFFLLRLQFKKAFRRMSRGDATNLQEGNAKAWYYQPTEIRRWSKHAFRVIDVRPIGVTLPPVYLERFFEMKKRWLMTLNRVERKLVQRSILSGMADHYVIDLQLR